MGKRCALFVSMAILMASPVRAGALTEELQALSPDSSDVWLSLARQNSQAFRAAVESLLVAQDLRDTTMRARAVAAGKAFCAVTRDSVLLSDVTFLDRASADARRKWSQAIELDRKGRGAKPDVGIPPLVKAIELYGGAHHLRREAVAWGTLGTAYRNAGDLPRAETCYKRALFWRERLGDPLWIGNALNTLGLLKQEQDEADSALVYLEQALAVRRKIGNPNDIARTLNVMGNVHQARQELNQAHELYESALATLGPEATGEVVINAREGLGNVASSLGNHAEALEIYTGVLQGWEAAGRDLGVANTRCNMALELRMLGRPVEALRELDKAQYFFQDEGRNRELARALNQASLAQRDLGNLSESLVLSSKALDRARKSGDSVETANILINLGLIQRELGAPTKALESLSRASAIADSLDNSVLRRDVLFSTAGVYGDTKDHARALTCLEKAIALDQVSGNGNKIAMDLGNIGMTKVALGDRDGMTALRRSIVMAESLQTQSILWVGMLNLADAYEVFGDLDSARVLNQRTIQVMESIEIGDLGEDEKAAFLESCAFVYEAQTNVLGKLAAKEPGQGHELEAWTVAEQGKSRALLDMLNDSTSVSASLQRTWRDVGLGASMDVVRRDILKSDTDVILEYAIGDSGSYLWAITKKSVVLHRLPEKQVIQDTCRLLRRALDEDPGRLRGRAPLAAQATSLSWRDVSAKLYGMVLAPAAAALNGAGRVVIVPDGALHYIPFELLLADGSATASYTLQGKTVVYAPSAGVLAHLSKLKPRQAPKSFLGVGDPDFAGKPAPETVSAAPVTEAAFRSGVPGTGEIRLPSLPHTREEIVDISHSFKKGDATVLLGDEARESRLEEPGFLSQFSILHFATHGLTNERFPKQCCLALSAPADSSTDGYLKAGEIYGLALNADLVVLSACETGKGKMVRGEGVMGLPRAFLYAGTRNVVVSLWSVSDEGTAELMKAFYREMVEKRRNPGEALARAKEEMLQTDRWRHPFYWAGFVLVGPG